MKSAKLSVSVLALAASISLLSACVPPAPGPTPTTDPTTTTTATPSPTPTTDPTPDPYNHELVIHHSGVGNVLLNELAVEIASSSSEISWDEDACTLSGTPKDGDGRWITTLPESIGFWGDPSSALTLAVVNDRVTRIDVFGTDLIDEQGIHIGSTLSDLLAAYPGMTVGHSGILSDVYYNVGTEGAIVYEVSKEDSSSPYWLPSGGSANTVFQIRVLPAGSDLAFTTAASGNIAGACSF